MLRLTSMVIVLLLALSACAAPPSEPARAATPAPDATPVSATPVTPATPTPVAAPAPAQSVPAPTAIRIDRSCRTDSDCAIKDVGNCCGAMPACVNANSPTDPAGVQAACAKSGRMGVCGFKAIDSCQCQQGQCTERSTGLDEGPEQVR